MPAVVKTLKSGLGLANDLVDCRCFPIAGAILNAVMKIPIDAAVDWLKTRFNDHSLALPKAIAAANNRSWQALSLALAGESFLGRAKNFFTTDGDFKAVKNQIRDFINSADTDLEVANETLRAKACDELFRLQKQWQLDEVKLQSIDIARFVGLAKLAEDAHRAVALVAESIEAEYPHLAQVLVLTPPHGGTPLLAAAYAYFFRREVATNAELSREMNYDQLRWLTERQQAGF